MHNGKNFCPSVILPLHFAEIRDQPTHFGRSPHEGQGQIRRHQGIDLAALQHRRKRLLRSNRANVDALRQIVPDFVYPSRLLLSSSEPTYLFGGYTVLVLQNAPNPDRHGHLVFGDPYSFPYQIFGFLNTRARVDEDARVAEGTRWEHRY